MIDHKLYATRGYYPTKTTTFSVATRGFSFGILVELGIKLTSYIKMLFAADSEVKTPVELESRIE